VWGGEVSRVGMVLRRRRCGRECGGKGDFAACSMFDGRWCKWRDANGHGAALDDEHVDLRLH